MSVEKSISVSTVEYYSFIFISVNSSIFARRHRENTINESTSDVDNIVLLSSIVVEDISSRLK